MYWLGRIPSLALSDKCYVKFLAKVELTLKSIEAIPISCRKIEHLFKNFNIDMYINFQ